MHHAKFVFGHLVEQLNNSEFKNEMSEAYKDEAEQGKLLVTMIT